MTVFEQAIQYRFLERIYGTLIVFLAFMAVVFFVWPSEEETVSLSDTETEG